MSNTENTLDKLKQKCKIENKQTKKGLDFLAGDKSYIDSSNNQDNSQSEPLKDQRKDITVDISVETPKTKDVKTPIKRDKINEFTAHLTNGVNTMKEIQKLVECVRDIDEDKKVNFGFSSEIRRSDRNLSQEIRDLNLKLKR